MVDDPDGADLDTVRAVRDAIERRVLHLLDELDLPRPQSARPDHQEKW